MFETSVAVVGYAITEPRVFETGNGCRVTKFRLASRSRRFDRATEQWVDGDQVVATVNCWKRLADGVSTGVRKSDPVVVTGRLRTREYEAGGQRRWAVEIEANAVGLDLSRAAPHSKVAGPEFLPPSGRAAPAVATAAPPAAPSGGRPP